MMKKLIAASSIALAAGTAGLTGASAHATTAPATTTATATKASCLGKGISHLPLNVRGVSPAARATAHRLQSFARHCDYRHLSLMGKADDTMTSFAGDEHPATLFKLSRNGSQPKSRPYDRLLQDLSTRPGVDRTGKQVSYVWPRVAASKGYKDRSAWQEAVKAGLATQQEADLALETGDGYYGWRLFVDSSGHWEEFVAGD